MSIVMTGGGTGGHLSIVRAVKEQIADSREQGARDELVYIGSANGQDRAWFGEDEDFAARYFLPTHGVVNRGIMGKIASVGMLARTTWQTMRLLRRHRAGVVFSVGGYSAAPAAFAAKLLRIPLVIHEQNAALGSLNRLLKPYATAFLSSYDPQSPVKAYPVQRVFFDRAWVRDRVETVIFLGGSQGAEAINELALSLAPQLQQRGIRILHQAGERHLERVREAYAELGVDAELFGFTSELPKLMERADLAIARAGASTLWELAANGLPTFFVPYPYAAGDHQYYNARYLVDQGAGWVVRQEDLNAQDVLTQMDTTDLSAISRKLMELSDPDGADQIAALLQQYMV